MIRRPRPTPAVDAPRDTEARRAARRAAAALQRATQLERRGAEVGANMREMNSANHITELFVDLLRGT